MNYVFSKGQKITYKYNDRDSHTMYISNNISSFCFSGSSSNNINSQLKQIKCLNANVNVVESNSFLNCDLLNLVDISKSNINHIQSDSFSNCNNLYCIILPLTISQMDNQSINNCQSLNIVNFYGYEQDI